MKDETLSLVCAVIVGVIVTTVISFKRKKEEEKLQEEFKDTISYWGCLYYD